MTHPIKIHVDTAGNYRAVFHPSQRAALEPVLIGTTTADEPGMLVEPWGSVIQSAFRWLRRCFGRDGLVADFTRTWKCKWSVTDLETGERFGPFQSHESAVSYEIQSIMKGVK